MNPPAASRVLSTSTGEYPLHECRIHVGEREWVVQHTGAILTFADEAYFLNEMVDRLPYGVALWPSAIALAHEIATRADAFRGKTVLELGAGTGLPGIVAAALGARVVQTDRQEVAMYVCRRNGERNGVGAIEHRLADWCEWLDAGRYDWILGSDILYAESMHEPLRNIFQTNLAPGGRLLLADPFRGASIRVLETLEQEGWRVTMSKWTVGSQAEPRAVGVFELARATLPLSPGPSPAA